MLRTLVAVFVLLGLLAGWACAQTPGAEPAPAGELDAGQLPDLSDQAATGQAVADLADFICGCLNDSGTVPDWASVQTVSGRPRRVSAAEVFVLLARTVYLWNSSGEIPATVPITPQDVNPPQLDAEDIPQGEFDPESGREINTKDFLGWCADTVYWVDRLHTIPTAVWLVDGERLSATEYLAGLAICVQYGYFEDDLLDYIFLPAYAPPQSWVKAFQAAAPEQVAAEEGVVAEEATAVEPAASEEASAAPAGPEGALAPEEEQPQYPSPSLVLLPEPGKQVSGVVDMLAVYSGPPADYVIFGVDGKTKTITNAPPYTYRWDTSALAPGSHAFRARIYGEDDVLLIDQVSAYTVVPPKPAPGGQAK